MGTSNPLVDALDAITGPRQGGTPLLMERLFGDRPEVLEAVIRARRDRKLSHRLIAETLSQDGATISEGSVRNWLRVQGIH